MPVAELDIRNAIVALIQSVDTSAKVFNRLRLPASGLLAELNVLTVDDAGKINVVFVRRASFKDEVVGIPDEFSSATENYELWFYRGIVDATDGTDSESALQLFIENVRAAMRLDANSNLGISVEGFDVVRGGLTTVSSLVNTEELGN